MIICNITVIICILFIILFSIIKWTILIIAITRLRIALYILDTTGPCAAKDEKCILEQSLMLGLCTGTVPAALRTSFIR